MLTHFPKDNSLPLFHWEQAQVKGYDCDIHQQASLPAMIRMMHESAMQHVLRLKVSARELAPMNLAWVLYQEKLDVFKRPHLGQTLKILTHPSGKARVFTYRDFHVFDLEDQLLAQASSTWLLMDTQNRRIARYPDFIENMLSPSNEFSHLSRSEKLAKLASPPAWTTPVTVQFHDLDFNGHLSNIHYFSWMLDILPHETLAHQHLQQFQICFHEECYLGDTLTIEAQPLENQRYAHVIRKGEKAVAEALSKWGDEPQATSN